MAGLEGRAAVASASIWHTATTERGPPSYRETRAQNAHKLPRNGPYCRGQLQDATAIRAGQLYNLMTLMISSRSFGTTTARFANVALRTPRLPKTLLNIS